eukprot:98906_1
MTENAFLSADIHNSDDEVDMETACITRNSFMSAEAPKLMSLNVNRGDWKGSLRPPGGPSPNSKAVRFSPNTLTLNEDGSTMRRKLKFQRAISSDDSSGQTKDGSPLSSTNAKHFSHLPDFLRPAGSPSEPTASSSLEQDISCDIPSTWKDSMDDFNGNSGSSDLSGSESEGSVSSTGSIVNLADVDEKNESKTDATSIAAAVAAASKAEAEVKVERAPAEEGSHDTFVPKLSSWSLRRKVKGSPGTSSRQRLRELKAMHASRLASRKANSLPTPFSRSKRPAEVTEEKSSPKKIPSKQTPTSTNVALLVSEMDNRLSKRLRDIAEEAENLSSDVMSLRSTCVQRIDECSNGVSSLIKTTESQNEHISSLDRHSSQIVKHSEEVRRLCDDVSELRTMVSRNLELVDRIFSHQCKGRPLLEIFSRSPAVVVDDRRHRFMQYAFLGLMIIVFIAYMFQVYS